MDLKNFVAETLVEIQQGVQLAIKKSRELQTSGVINPVWGTAKDAGGSYIKEVQFDIAVTVSDKSSGNIEGGIRVVGINLGKESLKSEESTHISRIQFSIPVVPPVTEVNPEHRVACRG